MIENETLVKVRKKNMKLYPIYRMLSFDCIFIYAIKFIFLTQIKQINASDVILSTSMFALFMVLIQVPATILMDKIGYRKTAFISNVSNIVYAIILLFSTNLIWLLIAEFISAITFSLKEIADPILLNSSIPKTSKKGKIFSKIEGKGASNYYYLNAITAVLSGFIYAINPYLPFICCAIISVIASLLNLQFEEVKEEEREQIISSKQRVEQYMQELKEAFGFIFTSKRLRSLILYSGLIWGVHCLLSDYEINLLQDIGSSAQIIGIITALLYVASAIAAKKQLVVHERFKNKTLSVLGLSISITTIIMGLAVFFKLPFWICITVITICSMINYACSGMYNVLIKRYLANFSNKEILPKIYSANSIGTNITRTIIGIAGSILIGVTNSMTATILVGVIFTVLLLLLLFYMRTRVGLKPEEYEKKEIQYSSIK